MSHINRIGFMAEMNNLLLFMKDEDRQRVLKRYDSMFDQAGAEGEETLLRCLGSPVRQVLQIEQEYRDAVEKGKTPFTDMDITIPTSGMEECWQPNVESRPGPRPDAEAAEEGVRSIPSAEEDLMAEPLIPEETPVEHLPESEIPDETPVEHLPESEIPEEAPVGHLPEPEIPEETPTEDLREPEDCPPEPVSRAEEIVPTESEEDNAPIPELVPEEIIPPEISIPVEEKPTPPPAPTEEADRLSEQTDRKPGAGRIVAAVFATFPMIVMWVLFFAVSLALGAAVLAVGAAFAAAAIYLMSYLFSRMITYIPDVMLVSGGVLAALGLALLLIWCGLWIAIGGCALTVRISRAIYHGILGVKEED